MRWSGEAARTPPSGDCSTAARFWCPQGRASACLRLFFATEHNINRVETRCVAAVPWGRLQDTILGPAGNGFMQYSED